jgi:methyl-accepting chemotaxis protein
MLIQSIITTTILAMSLTFSAGESRGEDDEKDQASDDQTSADEEVKDDTPKEEKKEPTKAKTVELNDPTLSEHDKKMVETAMDFAAECADVLQKWVTSKEVSMEKLFSYLYYPQEGTNPAKFNTDYDSLSDRDIQSILEKYLTSQSDIIFTVIQDKNGYIPTHNLKYSKKLTGDRAKDLVVNRTKRIFADKTGLAASRNQKPYLFQNYKRDTGQFMTDLSVPIYVNGRHWGCIRIGYLRSE